MRSWQAVKSVRATYLVRTLLLCGALWERGGLAAPPIGTERATEQPGPAGTVLPSGRTELLQLQKRLEDQYQRSQDRSLLLTLGDVASALKQSWLAASLYVNHQRSLDVVSDALTQKTSSDIAKAEARAVRVFVVYQAQSGSPLTLRVDDRVVGSLPLDGWILLEEGSHTLSIEGAGPVKTFRPEPLSPGQAPRTIVLTDFGPPIVSTGVTVAIDGTVSVRSESVSALESALVSGIESNLVVALRPASGMRHLRVVDDSCRDACQSSATPSPGVSYVLQAKLQQRAATWQAELAVRHREANQVAASASWSCTSCDDQTLRAQLQRKVGALMGEALGRQTVPVRMVSEPSGASVRVAGEPRGITPLQTVLLEGAQRLRISKDGYLPLDTEQTLTEPSLAASQGQLRFVLTVDPLAQRARRLAAAKWSVLGIGIVAAAAGGTLLALDGWQTCGDSALVASGTCPQSLSTLPWASAGLAIGAAAILTAPILYVFERKARRQMQSSSPP